IENTYYGPVVVNFTNDDFTADLNSDGYFDLTEQRSGQFVVYENNTFNSSAYGIIDYIGREVYIHKNTVNGNIPGNGTQNYPFANFRAQCSNHLHIAGTTQEYADDNLWVVDNTINGSAPIFAQFDTSGGDPANAGCANNYNAGTVGKYTVNNNTVETPPSYYHLVQVITSNIPLELPNSAGGNVPSK